MSRYNPDHTKNLRYRSALFFGFRSGDKVDNLLTMLRYRNSNKYKEDDMVNNYEDLIDYDYVKRC